MKTIISLVLLCLSLSANAIEINSIPYTISVPGVYTLERNLTATAAVFITIQASDVTLDLGGYTLSGSASQWAIHVKGPTTTQLPGFGGNVKIHNGGIRNFKGGGIFFDSTFSCSAEDLTIQAGAEAILDQLGGSDSVRRCNLYTLALKPTVSFINTGNCLVEHNQIFNGAGYPGIQSCCHGVHAINLIIGNFVTTGGSTPLDIKGDINSGNFAASLGD